jgi:hypothetical protein
MDNELWSHWNTPVDTSCQRLHAGVSYPDYSLGNNLSASCSSSLLSLPEGSPLHTSFRLSSRDERPDGSGHGFRRRACFIPVSTPLQRGIRFFHPPLPAPPTAFLAVGLPSLKRAGQGYGLTEFRA